MSLLIVFYFVEIGGNRSDVTTKAGYSMKSTISFTTAKQSTKRNARDQQKKPNLEGTINAASVPITKNNNYYLLS